MAQPTQGKKFLGQMRDPIRAKRCEEFSWLTLITCRGYDEKTNSYLYRTVVRAVMMRVQ